MYPDAVPQGPVRFTRVGDEWIGYRETTGSEDRAILFLPTLASNVDISDEPSNLRSFFDRVTEFASVVSFDRRGTGVSDGVAGAIVPTLEDWADDALAVLDATGYDKVSLVAHGLGVAPALSFAAGYPSRVESLVLIQGFARSTSCEGYEIGVPNAPAFIDRIVGAVAESWGEGVSFFTVHP
jgi:pimeloyl-ACP methyl ester carboxylesterase